MVANVCKKKKRLLCGTLLCIFYDEKYRQPTLAHKKCTLMKNLPFSEKSAGVYSFPLDDRVRHRYVAHILKKCNLNS